MKLRNFKQLPFAIANLLAKNKKILSLIYNDSKDSLTAEIPELTLEDLVKNNYINFFSATESGIKDIERNTFIFISLEDVTLFSGENNSNVSGAVFITTDKAHCLLANNKIRLLELADEIDTVLQDYKFPFVAGKIRVTSINYVVFSEFRGGYRINFYCSDAENTKAEL